jgi:hypothetical protein
VRLAAGNENEQHHLLPLVDELLERGIKPTELWADRGYDSAALAQQLRARRIEPRISKRRRPGQAIPAGTTTREVWRGKRRQLKTRDPPSPPPLADRTHQRLAQSQTPDRHPPRPQTRHLPRLPPTRDDPDPRPIILRPAPDTDSSQGRMVYRKGADRSTGRPTLHAAMRFEPSLALAIRHRLGTRWP